MRGRLNWLWVVAALIVAVVLGRARATGASDGRGVAGSACVAPVGLINGGFEQPVVGQFVITDQGSVPGWSTTEADGKIELWHTGYLGVPAAAGEQFAELSAKEPGELYEDRVTVPGSVLTYAVSHRGRNGVDTMQVQLGPPGGASNFTREVSTGNTAWREVFGTYTVPPGQTVTRFGFVAVRNAGGDPTQGNFLDNVLFAQSRCALSVSNALAPSDDPGRFDLLAGGQVLAARAGSGQGAGPVALPLDDVAVSERAAPGTDADAYASAIRCSDATTGQLLAQAAGTELTLALDRPRDVRCVFVNVRSPAVVLRKVLEPPADAGRFDLRVGRRLVAEAAGDGTVAGPVRVHAGRLTVSEHPAAGTNGGDYDSAIQCRDRVGFGRILAQTTGTRASFDIAPGALVACVLLNLSHAPPAPAPGPSPTPRPGPGPSPPTPVPMPASSVDLRTRATALGGRSVPAGALVRFRVSVTNRGPIAGTNVRVIPTLRQAGGLTTGRTAMVARRAGICVVGPIASVCELPHIAVGQTVTLTVSARSDPLLLEPVRLLVGAFPEEPELTPADNLAAAGVDIRVPPPGPCLLRSAATLRPLC